ncbi:hypothetical protein PoB_001336200 [Plakobranchus ocellatus]|uniref:Uncharacterized protein n=1 Tax=Plakobranchus ocellatus TaxID=259542 RepID=A0AAV3YXF5_9GAST|nr:hypothetical protein PoB_001336200 [Plakobranchus ocellatus]
MNSAKCPQTSNAGHSALPTPFVRAQCPNYQAHYGWNPVYWSDFPKQPMWTVPLPKIEAPISVPHNEAPPRPRCMYPPKEVVSADGCPEWVPAMPYELPSSWNPFINEDNIPYSTLVGPLNR